MFTSSINSANKIQAPLTNGLASWIPLTFAVALVYQIIHWIEHVAQVYQHWWLGLAVFDSHGIIFFFDLEWNHFVFNSLYFIALLAIFWGLGLWRPSIWKKYGIWGSSALTFALVLQGYHQFEHILKIIQHLTLGCEPCPGLLGWYIDGVNLHFTFNTLVLAFPLIVFFRFGMFTHLRAFLDKRPA